MNKKNKIGEGWQYSVYDIGNGRVYKKFHSWWVACWIITKTIFPFKYNPIWKISSYASSSRRRAVESFCFLEKCDIDRSLLGNFERRSDLDIEQDKVVALESHLKKCSLPDGQKIIDEFILLNKIFLQKGFIDKSFNIGKNFGIDKNKNVILIDIGELYNNKQEIQQQINNRAWAKYYIVDYVPENLREYFVDKMDENFLDYEINYEKKCEKKYRLYKVQG